MSNTPYLSLPEIDSGQSDKSVTHNDGLQILDIIVQRGIVDKDLSTPPGSPTTGAAYIVQATGTGAWAGHDNSIAYYRSGWVFVAPWEGLTVWVNDEDVHYTYDGSAWSVAGGGASAFTDLTDAPASYSGAAGKGVRVNSAGTGLEFYANEVLERAVSDESTDLTTGTAKITFRMPFAMTVTAVRANVNTVSSSGVVTVDINEAGSSILSTKLTIDASEKTSTTAATPAVISDSSLADDAEMTVDIDTAGTGAKGLKIAIYGYRT